MHTIDTYILLNKKQSFIIKIFIYIIIFFTFLVFYILFSLNYTSYFYSNSNIVYKDNDYYLKIVVNPKDIHTVLNNNIIIINNKKYMYQIYKIDSSDVNNNYNSKEIIYLNIFNLEKYYYVNNNELSIKIVRDKKVLIDYLK